MENRLANQTENVSAGRAGSAGRLAFVGSYAEPDGPGLYACRFDESDGSFTVLDTVSGLKNPTFLDLDPEGRKLYVLSEGEDEQGRRCGMASAYEIDPASGALRFVNREITVPASTCHITLDRDASCLMTASYHGGMIGMSPLLEDGRVGEISDVRQHSGSSVLPVQSQPRAHSVTVDRNNRYAIACDLGLDRIFVYRLDLEAFKFVPHREVAVAPGSGPRHFAFRPDFRFAYAIHELNATISAFSYDEEQGELREIQAVSTLPASYQGENACAEIALSADGRFVYGSNRGHDSIVVYAVDPDTGLLAYVEHVSTLGGHPRHFALSPDGRYLAVANRDSNELVTFRRDASTGRLTPAGQTLALSKPVCIKFLA
ncbi:lactonase family protein [Cohnella caldifontis]|uniref:lactonase family protein n=1 Tax=Cohnella caldifontis TaxID=3027471 RepID=UPI0023ED7653|nr:lactonase family protein [Cohnella sp. YIM B05605]